MATKSQPSKYDRALKLARVHPTPPKRVYDLLLSADQEGDARATYALATWYIHGSPFTEINLSQAVKLLKKAAKADVPEAIYTLGIAYEKGEGIEKNLALAFESYVRAALLGDPQSYFEVGRMYHWGVGVEKNLRLAKYWYLKAESLGVKD